MYYIAFIYVGKFDYLERNIRGLTQGKLKKKTLGIVTIFNGIGKGETMTQIYWGTHIWQEPRSINGHNGQ